MRADEQARLEPVTVRLTEERFPTYLPAAPDRHPMFLDKRVYQGSRGTVYPLPFTDRIAETPVERAWRAIWIENEYLQVLILPEIGGRIHVARDRTNGYDFIYRQSVIKPALVGLAGPWLSGGIEMNWPQHHRPATFLPVDHHVEEHADGSKTVWLSDHDPLCRMKGMHGVCLHPGQAVIELKVRAYNRTPLGQTFLWWANVATRVHEAYQSFFPPDVTYVADHARRATSEYPLCRGKYYGVDYGARARDGVPADECPPHFVPPHCGGQAPVDYAPNDLSWYANIPVPTSYMAMGSRHDFFGGYDHAAAGGIIHVADHHISPGKKQWTWGNHPFGYAWDRHLTDTDGPYIELMAGVYTDNQPDFSFLQPGETKSWSQFWYPIQQIGPASHANREAAVSLRVANGAARVGVSVSAVFREATVTLEARGQEVARLTHDLAPGSPLVREVALSPGTEITDLTLRVADAGGRAVITYRPEPVVGGEVPPPAAEPPQPEEMSSIDELYLTGLHLDQYRHVTRCPTRYWREALRRDLGDSRCNNALGLWHLRRGEWADAEACFRRTIARLTARNANPYDGEPLYHLGLCLRYQIDAAPPSANPQACEDACAAFAKATWNQAWAAAAYHALAEMDCRRGDWLRARDHLRRSLRFDTDNLRARNLHVVVLRKLGRTAEADALLAETLALDPLDWWARHLSRQRLTCDHQTFLDLAHDHARAGLYAEAIALLETATPQESPLPTQSLGAWPMIAYTLGWLHERLGNTEAAQRWRREAARRSPDYCFPARLEEIAVLESAIRADANDAPAPYYLGNLFYDRRRHEEAITQWERCVALDRDNAIAWRNLGIAYHNVRHDLPRTREAFIQARQAARESSRLLYEWDQMGKRFGEGPRERLPALEERLDLVRQRDDLSVELCRMYNQTGRHDEALAVLTARRFQPWEGGEGQALTEYVRTRLALGRRALAKGDAGAARAHFEAALDTPDNLGENRHLLANASDVHYWLGEARAARGETEPARRHWHAAATFRGDFQEMSVRAYSEMTYYSALAWRRLGRADESERLLTGLLDDAERLEGAEAKVDYFATSLPTMLLFDDDLAERQRTTARFLQAQAHLGLGHTDRARQLLGDVLHRDPNHAHAADLMQQLG